MPTPTPSSTAVAGGPGHGGPEVGGSGRGSLIDLTGTFRSFANPLLVWLVTTAGGVFFFVLLLRRSRDDDTWSNGALLMATSPNPVAPRRSGAPRAAAVPPTTLPAGEAAALPPPRVHARTFDKPPAKGVERAKVGYRRVRLSSKPDAVRSVELGRLDRGDEVEIVDSYEGFLQVLTADGITGWILRHTIVGAPSD